MGLAPGELWPTSPPTGSCSTLKATPRIGLSLLWLVFAISVRFRMSIYESSNFFSSSVSLAYEETHILLTDLSKFQPHLR